MSEKAARDLIKKSDKDRETFSQNLYGRNINNSKIMIW